MKHFSLVALLLHLFRCNLVFALFSPKQLEIFSVFVKPYGISFKGDLILNVSRKLEKCTAFNTTFKECNSVFVNLTSSTTKDELSRLESLSKNCPSGSYGCFLNYTVKSDQVLQGWFIRMQAALKELCKEHCWQALGKLLNKCIQATQSGIKESDKTYIQFVIEVLKSLCIQDDGLSCTDKFVNGLRKNSSSSEVCKINKNSMENTCSSQCHLDMREFINNLGCCVGSVSRIMECYSIQPQSDSYGVFVKESYSRCGHLKRPAACTQDTQNPCPSSSQRSPTTSGSSSKGKQIAGICLAVIICVGLAIIVGNFLYRRLKRRAKIRFEDYGYSRLKMLEDEYYFDVEVDDDDDENKGLVQL